MNLGRMCEQSETHAPAMDLLTELASMALMVAIPRFASSFSPGVLPGSPSDVHAIMIGGQDNVQLGCTRNQASTILVEIRCGSVSKEASAFTRFHYMM